MSLVQVVDRAAFFGGRWPQGYHPFEPGEARAFLERALQQARFVERPLAESTPAWKQWIPYCVLRCAPRGAFDGAHADCGVFAVQRTRGAKEARLHGAWSIGLGGHVEPDDAMAPGGDAAAFYARALGRELAEELVLPEPLGTAPRLLGLMNDDSTEVGAVHAGLVYVLDLPMALAAAQRTVAVREVDKMAGGFTHLAGLRNLWLNRAPFESWSERLLAAGILGPMGDSQTAGA